MNPIIAIKSITILSLLTVLGVGVYYTSLESVTVNSIAVFPFFVYALHNCMNAVHLASHARFSRNCRINKIYGHITACVSMLSFVEFKKTHILHHAHPADKTKDPDYELSHDVPLLVIPFFIWKKDVYYIKNKLWGKRRSQLYAYITERVFQFSVLLLCIYFGWFVFLGLYFLALLITGYLNALFLFYFPHYTAQFETYNAPWYGKPLFTFARVCIAISRKYHTLHHTSIKTISVYFPVEMVIVKKLKGVL